MQPRIPVLYTTQQLQERVHDLAADIASIMPKELVVVGLLKGSFIFCADLVREMHRAGLQPQMDFMTLSSYGKGKESSGKVDILQDVQEEVVGKTVLIVDDILESGRTLAFARNLLLSRGAADVKIVVLLDKPGKRKVAVEPDFTGFIVPDRFVVGYGLDHAGYHRELPFIGYLEAH